MSDSAIMVRDATKKVLSRVRAAGAYKVQFLSHKARREAHDFYSSLGFEPIAHGFRLDIK